MKMLRLRAAAMVAGLLALPFGAAADEPVTLSFVNAATFFSQEAGRERAIDPQVFVFDASSPVDTGPEGIEHVAGLRNARLDDPQEAKLYAADGTPLLLSLRTWLAARGTLEVETQPDGHDRVIADFAHLVPFGVYSLFDESFTPSGNGYAPLAGDSASSTFTANVAGSATVAIDVPLHLTHDNAVVLVYHSDAREHGASWGRLGVSAHEQLVARLP